MIEELNLDRVSTGKVEGLTSSGSSKSFFIETDLDGRTVFEVRWDCIDGMAVGRKVNYPRPHINYRYFFPLDSVLRTGDTLTLASRDGKYQWKDHGKIILVLLAEACLNVNPRLPRTLERRDPNWVAH